MIQMEPETTKQETKVFCANCEHQLTPTCVKCHEKDGFQPGDEWLCHDCCGEFYDPCPLAREVLNDLEDDGRLDALRLVAPLPGNEAFAYMIEQFDAISKKYATISLCVEDVILVRKLPWAEAEAWLKENEDYISMTLSEYSMEVIRDL